ncbi:MAG: cell surface protein SprA, partial [Saprospiraceae bacterium]|nr:cell surface protein SprA [Saprospiraceae bacterium]
RNFTENHTQFFKDTTKNNIADFSHSVPKDFGSMTISYSALSTLFQDDLQQIIDLFQTFEANRVVISQRLGEGEHTNPDLAAQGYTDGYGRIQQNVLIPAFLAAYQGEDPQTVGLDVFSTNPRVNWRLTYNGLSRLPLFRDIFQNFSLSHSYESTLTVNQFNTSLDFLRTRNQGRVNELNGNFFPRLEIPEIAIQEGFSPLVSVEATLRNGMAFSANFNKQRRLGMSFVSNQLSETQTKEIVIGFGYLIRDLQLGIFSGSGGRPQRDDEPPQTPQGGRTGGSQLQGNDLDINFDFSLRDDVTFNHLLDQDIIEPTRGNFSLSISPSAEYQINERLSLRMFFDYQRTVPKTSAGFPRTTSAGGFIVRFSLN